MYQPSHRKFEVDDPAALLAELSAAVPATLVTMASGGLRVSVLPMLFEPGTDAAQAADAGTDPSDLMPAPAPGVLRGHLARPNPQWRDIDPGVEALAIFQGPEAYVSPAWYEEKRLTGKVVPTWNYVTVLAFGSISLHPEPEWLVPHVRRLVERHEALRPEPWSVDDAPEGYIDTHARAIIGLELHITRIEGKRKLSQNRSEADIAGTIEGLASGTPMERAVADEMGR